MIHIAVSFFSLRTNNEHYVQNKNCIESKNPEKKRQQFTISPFPGFSILFICLVDSVT